MAMSPHDGMLQRSTVPTEVSTDHHPLLLALLISATCIMWWQCHHRTQCNRTGECHKRLRCCVSGGDPQLRWSPSIEGLGWRAGEPSLRTEVTRQEAVQQRQAVDQLQRHFQAMTAETGTSLETDQSLLADSSRLSARHAQAVRARLEQKQLIAAAQQALKTYTESMIEGVSLSRRWVQSR